MKPVKNNRETTSGSLDQYGRREISRGMVRLIIQATVLFSCAGTMHWPAAWVYVLVSACFFIFGTSILIRINPEVLNVRGRKPKDVPRFDKIILPLWILSQFSMLILAGMDAGHLHWSEVPVMLQAGGFLCISCGASLIIWSMAVNSHFETTVRIQNDRGHKVCAAGPYRLVRHPGYAGVILAALGGPLLLGSWVALIPGVVTFALFMWRTNIEDRILFTKLPGYSDFTAITRYRLAPGIW